MQIKQKQNIPVIGIPQNPRRALTTNTPATVWLAESTTGSVMKPLHASLQRGLWLFVKMGTGYDE